MILEFWAKIHFPTFGAALSLVCTNAQNQGKALIGQIFCPPDLGISGRQEHEYWVEWTKKIFQCQFTHVGGLIHQKMRLRALLFDLWPFENSASPWEGFGGRLSICQLNQYIYQYWGGKLSTQKPKLHSKISWVFSLILLYAIDIHNIGCVAPFLPPKDHFEIPFLLKCKFGLTPIGNGT